MKPLFIKFHPHHNPNVKITTQKQVIFKKYFAKVKQLTKSICKSKMSTKTGPWYTSNNSNGITHVYNLRCGLTTLFLLFSCNIAILTKLDVIKDSVLHNLYVRIFFLQKLYHVSPRISLRETAVSNFCLVYRMVF